MSDFAAAAPAPGHGLNHPWELRTRYSITIGSLTLDYDEGDSQWRVYNQADGTLADDIGFRIVLGDGTAIETEDLTDTVTTRNRMPESPLGPGTKYITAFPTFDGLDVTFELTSFRDRGILGMRLLVTNRREEPVAIERLAPVVAGPGSIGPLGTSGIAHRRQVFARGGRPVYGLSQAPLMTVFEDPDANHFFAVGVLPSGRAQSGTDFVLHEQAWQGEAFSNYSPAVALAPGETLESDKVGVLFGLGSLREIETFYGWAYSTMASTTKPVKEHPTWVSVPDNASFRTLETAAEAAKKAGINHVLVPANWESPPGSLRGAAGRYPSSMRDVTDAFRSMGMTPGITIDPLQANGRRGVGIMLSESGLAWIDPSNARGREEGVERIADLRSMGFQFVVVQPSQIPDAVLTAFGLTRNKADHEAFGVATDGAGDVPVYAAAASTLPVEADVWEEAVATVVEMARYGAQPAPVRIDANALDGLAPDLASIIREWPGPIEVVGLVGRGARAGAAALAASESSTSNPG